MALNAVERRLLDLRYQWERFTADPVPRLLVWTTPDAAMRLVRCFLEVQKHAGEYVTGDLFIVFDEPFENSIQYARALKEALAGHYAASAEDLAQEGLAPSWRANPTEYPDSAHGLVQMLRGFGGEHHQVLGHLVAVFAPTSVGDAGHFAAWLARTLQARLPERLRLLALDSLESPHLATLTPPDPALVRRETLELDATAVALETFAQERTIGPAGVFRNMLMALVALVEKGSPQQVTRKAADALAFAEAQDWKDQQAVVTMLVAGAWLKAEQHDEAIAAYRDARVSAAVAEQEGHPGASAIVLQSWFGEAGAELAAGRVADAAAAYGHAGTVAQTARNMILAIEAFRMAAFCHARLNQYETAREWGEGALALGERLRPEVRGLTTLPLAATDLSRVLDAARMTAADDLRVRALERMAGLSASLEAEAAQHERTSDDAPLARAEAMLAQGRELVLAETEQKLQALVGSAGMRFQATFQRTRALLGASWPMSEALDPSRLAAAGPSEDVAA